MTIDVLINVSYLSGKISGVEICVVAFTFESILTSLLVFNFEHTGLFTKFKIDFARGALLLMHSLTTIKVSIRYLITNPITLLCIQPELLSLHQIIVKRSNLLCLCRGHVISLQRLLILRHFRSLPRLH